MFNLVKILKRLLAIRQLSIEDLVATFFYVNICYDFAILLLINLQKSVENLLAIFSH